MRFNTPLDPITGNVIKASFLFTDSRSLMQTSTYWLNRVPAASIFSDVLAFGAALETLALAAFTNCLTANITTSGCTVSDVSSGVAPTVFHPWTGSPVSGAQSGASHDSILAAVLPLQTKYKGQHGRGRLFVGPIPELFVTSGSNPDRLNTVGITAYQNFVSTLKAAPIVIGGSSYDLCIATRPVQPATLVTRANAVLLARVDGLIGTVRRRMEGRGQ